MKLIESLDQAARPLGSDGIDEIVEAYRQQLFLNQPVKIDQILDEAEPQFDASDGARLRKKLLATLLAYLAERSLSDGSICDNLLLE